MRPCAGAAALTFSSGYLANLAILTALAGRGDAIFADRLNHACLNDGALLSRADLVRYPHADVAALEQRLAASTARRKLIATDAVFSMDGDIAPLPELAALADAHGAWLVVDDAHGFGVLGSRAERGSRDARAFRARVRADRLHGHARQGGGVAGAFVAAHPAVIDTLVETARSYVFTTAAPPLLAEALRASLRIIRSDAARHEHLRPADRAFSRAHASIAVAAPRLADARSSPSSSAAMRRRSSSPRRCGSADSGCPRSARRRFRRGPRGCACRSAPRTRPATSMRSSTLSPGWPRDDRGEPGATRARVDERQAARRIGRQRAAARAVARLGDAFGHLGSARRAARQTLSRPRRRSAGPRPQRARRAVHAGQRLRGGLELDSGRCGVRSPSSAGRSADSSRCAGRGRSRRASAVSRSLRRRRALRPEPTGRTAYRRRRLPASATSCTSRGRSRSSASSRCSCKAASTAGRRSRRCAGRLSRAASRRPKALFGALDAIVTTDLRAEVAGIAQPALVIAGGRDTLALPAAARWLGERLPDARFAPIDGAAHVPFLSHPDAFAAALDPFLDGR